MSKSNVQNILAFVLVIQCSSSYFLDFEAWSGEVKISSGTIIKNQDAGQKTFYFNSDEKTASDSRRNLQQQTLNRYEYYFGKQDKRNYLYNLPPKINWMHERVFEKQANNHPDMKGVRNMYLAIGIPTQYIEREYVPFLKLSLDYVDYLFSTNFDRQYESSFYIKLYTTLRKLKWITDLLVERYLKNVKMIIFGSNNRAIGHKLFISTDNMIVNANNSFIYNGGRNNTITGKNMMRTKRYEMNFDELEAIKKGEINKFIKFIRQ